MSGHCLLKICKDVYLQSLIEEEELSFELREEIVYQYDGEPLNILCISDANYGRKETSFCSMEAPGNCQELPYSRQELT